MMDVPPISRQERKEPSAEEVLGFLHEFAMQMEKCIYRRLETWFELSRRIHIPPDELVRDACAGDVLSSIKPGKFPAEATILNIRKRLRELIPSVSELLKELSQREDKKLLLFQLRAGIAEVEASISIAVWNLFRDERATISRATWDALWSGSDQPEAEESGIIGPDFYRACLALQKGATEKQQGAKNHKRSEAARTAWKRIPAEQRSAAASHAARARQQRLRQGIDAKALSKSIGSFRLQLGFTQAQFSEALAKYMSNDGKPSQPLVARWESGKVLPSPKYRQALLKLAVKSGYDLRFQ